VADVIEFKVGSDQMEEMEIDASKVILSSGAGTMMKRMESQLKVHSADIIDEQSGTSFLPT